MAEVLASHSYTPHCFPFPFTLPLDIATSGTYCKMNEGVERTLLFLHLLHDLASCHLPVVAENIRNFLSGLWANTLKWKSTGVTMGTLWNTCCRWWQRHFQQIWQQPCQARSQHYAQGQKRLAGIQLVRREGNTTPGRRERKLQGRKE